MRRNITENKIEFRHMIMWGRLKGGIATTLSSKIKPLGFRSKRDDSNLMWVTMDENIQKAAKETLHVSTRKRNVYKESVERGDAKEDKGKKQEIQGTYSLH